MNHSDDPEKLLIGVIKLLSIRPRSRQEIEKYLQKKTKDSTLINQTINRLIEMSLIDDSKFATWLIESRSRSSPRGLRFLLSELKSKGVNLDPGELNIDESALAEAALGKKIRNWSHLTWQEFRLKAGRFLASRGFSWPTIESTVKKGYNESHVS